MLCYCTTVQNVSPQLIGQKLNLRGFTCRQPPFISHYRNCHSIVSLAKSCSSPHSKAVGTSIYHSGKCPHGRVSDTLHQGCISGRDNRPH